MKNTKQISRVRKSKNQLPQISANGKLLERVTSHKFLTVLIQQKPQMDWSGD